MTKVIFIFILRGASMLVSFLLSIVIVKKLGTEQSGVYFYSISFIALITSIVSLGLGRDSLKKVSMFKENVRRSFTSSLLPKIIVLVTITYIVFLIIFGFLPSSYIPNSLSKDGLILPISLIIFPYALNQILSFVFQGMNKLILNVIYLNFGMQLFVLIILFLDLVETLSVLYYYILSFNLIMLIIGVYHITYFKFRFRLELGTLSLIKDSIPLFISNIISQIFSFSIVFFLEYFYSSTEVSYLSVCLRLAAVLSIVNFSISRVYAQKFGLYVSEKKWIKLKKNYIDSMKYGVFILAPMILFVALFSKQILSIYNKDFEEQYNILIILAIGQLFSFAGVMSSFVLQMLNQELFLRNIYYFIGGITILVAILLTKMMGVDGAAIAILLNYVLISFFLTSKSIKLIRNKIK